MPLSVAVLVDTRLLQSLFEGHWQHVGIEHEDASARALVLYLPETYAFQSVWLATRQPDVINAPQLNLRNNSTYLGWRVDLAGETESTIVRLPVYGLHNVFSETYRYDTHKWGWMPMVVVTGGKVVVGGFLVDESFILGLQAAAMSAQCCVPENVYSKDELKSASEQATVHGLEPWVYARWYEDEQWTVQPELFGFTE